MRKVFMLSPFYGWEYWEPKKLINVPTVTQLVSGRELRPEPRSQAPGSMLIITNPDGLQLYTTAPHPKLQLSKSFEEPYLNSPNTLGIFLSENRAASMLTKFPYNTNIRKM